MALSPSASTPRSGAPSTYKMSHASPSESYFSPVPAYSTIPVSTPHTSSSSSAPATSLSHNSKPATSGGHSLSLDQGMLDHFAARFPPPPALSLPAQRQLPLDAFTPRIVTCHRTSLPMDPLPSPTDRAHRSPPSAYLPSMDISSSPGKHTFRVLLPRSIGSEMITVSANKGDKLKVVADAWHMQSDCHYEWQIQFAPRDIDLTAVQAKLEPNGYLIIDVRRISGLAVAL